MNLTELFNAEMEKRQQNNFERLPEGTYHTQFVDVSHKVSPYGNSLSFRLKVTEGEHKNRVIFHDVKLDFDDMSEGAKRANLGKIIGASSALGINLSSGFLDYAHDVDAMAQMLVNAFKTKLNSHVDAILKNYTYTNKNNEEKEGQNCSIFAPKPMQNNVIDTPSDDDMPF